MNQDGIFHQHLQGDIDAILLHNNLCVLSSLQTKCKDLNY